MNEQRQKIHTLREENDMSVVITKGIVVTIDDPATIGSQLH